MATPLPADRLVAALRAEGVIVVEHDGWRTHNRNQVGAWGPVNGVMIHHTVSSGTSSSVELCYNGYAGLPGPLCHGVIAKDGTVHLVGNGRANHAGGGDPNVLQAVIDERYGERPPAPHQHQGSAGAVDGNARFYGFECVNLGNGTDPWPAAQLDAIERASAAICRAHGWGAKSVIGHLEWSDQKSDPRGFTMPGMRKRVEARLAKPTSSQPTPTAPPAPPSEEDGMTPTQARQLAEVHKALVPYMGWQYNGHGTGEQQADAWHLLNTTAARVGALTAAVAKLAEGGGLDAAEIQAAAEAGARAALAELGDALTN
jgi:hypothetical protein